VLRCSMQTELNTYLNDILAMNTDCANQCLQPTMAAMRYSHSVFVAMQAAVPKFMQLRLEPASSSTLAANSSDAVTQKLHVKNNMHGQKPLVMRLRIGFTSGGANKVEQAEVKNFPAGL